MAQLLGNFHPEMFRGSCPRVQGVVGPLPNMTFLWLGNGGEPNYMVTKWDDPPPGDSSRDFFGFVKK